jgi:hypothetical protein
MASPASDKPASESSYIRSDSDYAALFAGFEREALAQAHDIRKFEIELYWKRASYFWTIIAVAFAGFFSTSQTADISNSYAIACLGFIVSLGWYQVNRASSAWQRNWEIHVDLLEDGVTGPLHKAIMNRRSYPFWDLAGPYAYSPSRLNAIMSLVVVGAWLILLVRSIARTIQNRGDLGTIYTFSLLLVLASIAMFVFAHSGRSRKYRVRTLHGRVRRYK